MDALSRRGHLKTTDSPNTRTEYLVSLSGDFATLARVDIRYVPDQTILTPDSLAHYLHGLADTEWNHLEDLAVAILSDLNNELVPRWVQVTVSGTSAEMAHRVTLEDRQPRWDNVVLLSRIGSI